MRIFIVIVLILAVIGVGVVYVKYGRTESAANFRMAKVERGDMSPTIGATGTIEPEEVVDVGAQVAGLIKELKVDYGSAVEQGTVLARIDDTKYKAQVDQAEAALGKAKADLKQMEAKLVQTEAEKKRAENLIKTKSIADSDYDTAVANYEVAKAIVDVGKAAIRQAEASLKLAQTDFGYTVITSPVKGVIVDRRVNVGQTVVSALNAPSLFLLAKDLGRMQVWASVNEADIGRISKGMKVHFTVDTYPNENFLGEVSQIRLNASMTQNVVTYTVVVTTDNKAMKLLPYMTANLLFEIEHHENVLRVPNAALRWKPRKDQIAPDVRETAMAEMNRRGDKSKRGDKKAADDGEKTGESAAASSSATAPDQPKPESKSTGAAPAAPAGTAATPEAYKARTEKHARHEGKPLGSAAPAQPATTGHGPPGKPVPPQELEAKKEHRESGRLWVVDGAFVRPVAVKIVATDGTMTEVRGPDLQEDMDIVIGENVAGGSDDTTNPFMPKFPRGGSGSKPK
jgi:HlyD family secretion protein